MAIALILELNLETKKIMVKFRYESGSPIIGRVFNKLQNFPSKIGLKAMNETAKNGPESTANY